MKFFRILYNSFQEYLRLGYGWEERSKILQIFKELFFSEFKPSSKLEREVERFTNPQGRRGRGVRKLLKKGEWPLAAPMGYEKLDGKLIPDENTSVVQQIFDNAIQGMPLTEISRKLHQGQNRYIPHQTIKYILTNPIYAGILRYQGKTYQGNHQPIVKQDCFDQVQCKIKTKVSHRKKKIDPSPELSLTNFIKVDGIENATLNGQFKAGIDGAVGSSYYFYYFANKDSGIYTSKDELDTKFSAFLVSYINSEPMHFDSIRFLLYYKEMLHDILSLIASEIWITEAQIFKLKSHPKRASNALTLQAGRLADLSSCQDIAIKFQELTVLESYGKSVINSVSSWKFMSDNSQREVQRIVFPKGVNLDSKSLNFSARLN